MSCWPMFHMPCINIRISFRFISILSLLLTVHIFSPIIKTKCFIQYIASSQRRIRSERRASEVGDSADNEEGATTSEASSGSMKRRAKEAPIKRGKTRATADDCAREAAAAELLQLAGGSGSSQPGVYGISRRARS